MAGDVCCAGGVFVGALPGEDTSGVSGLAAGASSFVGVPVPVGGVAEDSVFEFALGADGDAGAPASVPEKGAGPLPVGSVADEPPQALKKRTAALISPNR